MTTDKWYVCTHRQTEFVVEAETAAAAAAEWLRHCDFEKCKAFYTVHRGSPHGIHCATSMEGILERLDYVERKRYILGLLDEYC